LPPGATSTPEHRPATPASSASPPGAAELFRRVERVEQELGPLRGETAGRLEHLERELAALRQELRDLRDQLGG
jgi:uncharacterized protein (UPF0335 family)